MAKTRKLLKPEAHAIGVVAKRARKVFDKEGISRLKIAALANVYPKQIRLLLNGTGTFHGFVKIMHYIGYEIQFKKKRKPKDIEKNVAAKKRYLKFKKQESDAKRKSAGKPAITQRELRELAKQQQSGNFLGTED